MSDHTVDFWRTITDEDGRSHEVCEDRIHVDASSPSEARERAESMFCKARNIRHWSERADRVKIEGEETPARASYPEGEAPWSHVDT